MDEDEDLPDVGPPLTRKQYVINEVEHLIKFRMWPEEIAKVLDYENANSLNSSLVRWKRYDLAEHFERWRYDGNVPPSIVAQCADRKIKQKEKQAA